MVKRIRDKMKTNRSIPDVRSGSAGGAARPRDDGSRVKARLRIKGADLLRALILALAVLVAYLPARKATYLWDDTQSIIDNPLVQKSDGLWRIWTKPLTQPNEEHYWPLAYTSFWLECSLWGESLMVSHAINFLLHLCNALLVWGILRRLGIKGAMFGAALFALHPTRVETVAWLIERKDLLAAFFYLVAFWLYWEGLSRGGRKWFVAGLFAFTLAMLSKSIAVTLPFALLICMWWKRGSVTVRESLWLFPLVAVGVALTVADLLLLWHHPVITFSLTPVWRIVNAGRALWFYLGKWFLPVSLSAVYPQWQLNGSLMAGMAYPVAFVALVVVLWVLQKRLGRGASTALALFTLTLLPVLGFVDFSYMVHSYVADRFAYLACIPLATLVCGASTEGMRRMNAPAVVRVGAATLVCIALGALTFQRVKVFESLHTLSLDIIAKNPRAWSALTNEGYYQKEQGRLDAALALYEQALAIRQDMSIIHINVGSIYDERGEHEKARAAFQKAVEVEPTSALAHFNLGLELMILQRFPEAEKELGIASRMEPRDAKIQMNYGVTLMKLRRSEEAIKQFRTVLSLDPSNVYAYRNLGDLLLKKGAIEEGLGFMRKAVEMKPDEAAWANETAWVLATAEDVRLRDFKEAIRLAEQACWISHRKVPAYLNTLSVAYAGAGRYKEALAVTEEALTLLGPSDVSELAVQLRKRRDEYKSHQSD